MDTTTSAIAKLIAKTRRCSREMQKHLLEYCDGLPADAATKLDALADTLEAVTTNRDGLKGELCEQALEFDDMRAQLEAVTKENDALLRALGRIAELETRNGGTSLYCREIYETARDALASRATPQEPKDGK